MFPPVTPKKRLGRAKRHEVFHGPPSGLRDDADPESLCFEKPADDRHPEARMVDISVARDEDDVAAVPADVVHLVAGHRQDGRRGEPMRPMFTIAHQRGRHACRQRSSHSRIVSNPARREAICIILSFVVSTRVNGRRSTGSRPNRCFPVLMSPRSTQTFYIHPRQVVEGSAWLWWNGTEHVSPR